MEYPTQMLWSHFPAGLTPTFSLIAITLMSYCSPILDVRLQENIFILFLFFYSPTLASFLLGKSNVSFFWINFVAFYIFCLHSLCCILFTTLIFFHWMAHPRLFNLAYHWSQLTSTISVTKLGQEHMGDFISQFCSVTESHGRIPFVCWLQRGCAASPHTWGILPLDCCTAVAHVFLALISDKVGRSVSAVMVIFGSRTSFLLLHELGTCLQSGCHIWVIKEWMQGRC